MEFSAVVSIIMGVVFIGGLGWKVNAELSKQKLLMKKTGAF